MRIASTRSRYIAAPTTPTAHPKSLSSAKSISQAWISGLARQVPENEHECMSMSTATYAVDQVDLSKLPTLSVWKRDFTMETILIEIRRYMAAPANKKLPQPAEGTNF